MNGLSKGMRNKSAESHMWYTEEGIAQVLIHSLDRPSKIYQQCRVQDSGGSIEVNEQIKLQYKEDTYCTTIQDGEKLALPTRQ